MTRRELGKSRLRVSPLGVGCSLVPEDPSDQKAMADLIRGMIDEGVNLLDTAACYAGSEDFIGRELSDRRNEIVLVSKCGHHEILADGSMRSLRISESDIDAALERLRTDRIDVLLLHSYDQDLLIQGDAIEVLMRAKKAGKIRALGYSGDNETAAIAAAMAEVDVVETSLSIADQGNIDGVVEVARRHDVGVIAKRPISNAAWVWLEKNPVEWETLHAREYVERLQAMDLDITEFGEDWPTLALRFTLSIDGCHTAIVGTRDPKKVKANLAAVESGALSGETYAKLREAYRVAEEASGETWRGCN